jgi:predicted 2-oxoglutarate/Fe(II)-dependent dioxygenase YbiX
MIPTATRPLKDFIATYDFDLTAEAQAIASLANWRKHSWYNPATRQNHSEAEKELDVREIDDQPEVFNRLTDCLVDAAKRYADEFLTHAQITALSNVRLNRYPMGSVMRAHADHIHSIFDGEVKGIPAISLVGVLNDDYTGGDLVICGEPYRLKPGQIIAWPSCFLYPHEVTEITSGTRYSFVSWAW